MQSRSDVRRCLQALEVHDTQTTAHTNAPRYRCIVPLVVEDELRDI